MSNKISRALRVAFAFALLLCFSTSSFAQGTAGKITGQVIDKSTREPLPAASIRVEGSPMGSMADEKGNYYILNVPPGEYSLIVNVIGYAPIRVEGVRIRQDVTTYQNFELESTVLEVSEAVTVTADRPLVEKSLTSSRTIIDPEEIKALPIVNIAELVLTTAGSIGGNLRGGRPEDQQTTMDGATVTSQRGNTGQAFTVNPFMIQELEVKTGTFNAEYVNALSGLTSVVTKDGGSSFSGNLEYRTLGQKGLNYAAPPDLDLADTFRSGEQDAQGLRSLINDAIAATNAFNSDPARADDGLSLKFPFDVLDTSGAMENWTARYSREDFYWDYDRIIPEAEGAGFSYLTQGLQRAQQNSGAVDRTFTLDKYRQYGRNNRTEKRPVQLDWGMGGPIGGKLNWFASGRFGESWGRTPNAYSRTMNFFGKMTYRPTTSTKVSFSGLIEDGGFFSGKGQRTELNGGNYNRKYIAESLNESFNGRMHLNMSFTHTISPSTFYELRFSHLREYAESYNPRFGKSPLPNHASAANVTAIGYNPLETQGLPGTLYFVYGDVAYSDITNGNYTDIRPFRTDINYSITSQVNTNHQFKAGAGVSMNDYHESRRGTASGNAPLLFSDTNGNPNANTVQLSGWEYHVYPTEYFLYAQDRIEYGGLIVNAGLRLDIFDPKSNYINPFRPRVGPGIADDDPQYLSLHPSIKTGLAPRLGISHPITDQAALHYSYGVFNQRATLAALYDGLVQSYPFERNHGNPDLPYQKATNYEMGVQAEVYPGYHLDVTGYFRDVDDLPIFWAINPEANFIGGSQREIQIYLPTFAQDSRGFELSMRRAMANHFSLRANYTVAFTNDLTVPLGVTETIVNFSQYTNGTPVPATYQSRPSAFDRRHRIVTNLLIELPYGVSASFLTKAQSGNQFRTKNQTAADPLNLLGAAERSPWTWTTDLYAQKVFTLGGGTRLGVFTQVNNLFNRTNFYTIGDTPAAERWIRRGDPVGFIGGPLPGLGSQGNTPRDVWVGFNMAW
jgi:hypothetical protein